MWVEALEPVSKLKSYSESASVSGSAFISVTASMNFFDPESDPDPDPEYLNPSRLNICGGFECGHDGRGYGSDLQRIANHKNFCLGSAAAQRVGNTVFCDHPDS